MHIHICLVLSCCQEAIERDVIELVICKKAELAARHAALQVCCADA
jgi:hypothetical protein